MSENQSNETQLDPPVAHEQAFNINSPYKIILAGTATLFVELTLIRFIPGQVRILGYFTNFVLLAAFLGFGAGMLSSRRWEKSTWISTAAPFVLFGILALTELGRLFEVIPSNEQVLFLEYHNMPYTIPLYPFLTISFTLLAICFLPIGNFVGHTLKGQRPLWRYGLNIFGSIVGICLFVGLSASSAPPWLWVFLSGIFCLFVMFKANKFLKVIGVLIVLATTAIAWQATRDTTWSPYQKINMRPIYVLPEVGVVREWKLPNLTEEEKKTVFQMPFEDGFTILVNDDSHQTPINFSPEAIKKYPSMASLGSVYDFPFTLKKEAGDVLILGAGSGNDAAGALRAGAKSVDSVEIDPEILRLGKEHHPERPYDDPRVTVYVEDARTFLANTKKKYDFIIYGMLDSHVLMSHKSNIRLDSFVFTKESFSLARKCLKPDGLLVVSHAIGANFFFERMRATLAAGFGKPPWDFSDVGRRLQGRLVGTIYITGEQVPPGPPVKKDVTILEDDWPFVYLRNKKIPTDYLIVMALMALVTVVTVRVCSGKKWQGTDFHFFALGAGFLLLETRGISALSILVGSTWGVNSAIFLGILIMSLLATVWAARLQRKNNIGFPWIYYGLLAAFLLINFTVPLNSLITLPLWTRIALGVLLLSCPLFASGVIFANSLAHSGNAERALASNLLGALLGGLVEYTSMSMGFRYLLIPASLLYFLAFILNLKGRNQ